MKNWNDVYVYGGRRTPFVRSFGSYLGLSTQELMTESLKELVQAFRLEGDILGDVILGAVMKSSKDWNLARECLLGSKLSAATPAADVQRACGTSLEATNLIFLKIASGQIESGIAGGVDTNSDLPFEFPKSFAAKVLALRSSKTLAAKIAKVAQFRLRDWRPEAPWVVEPRTGLSMGDHCERMVKEWKISRRDQDQWAWNSHQNAAKSYEDGYQKNLVFTFKGLQQDQFIRKDTTIEKLGKLPPAFDKSSAGTLTAGNSTPLTDGSAAVLLGSRAFGEKKGLKPLAKIVDAEVAAVDFVRGEGLLMAPTIAVARLIQRNQIKLQDFDLYEIHEAFAGQVLCTLRAWESADYCQKKIGLSSALGAIDISRINKRGGSLALGHPFGATGARLVANLSQQLNERGSGRGLISVCTGGGMGVAMIVEALQS